MFLTYFALGALAGVLFRDRRALSCIVPAAAVLVFIGLRDHHFADWFSGLAWFFGNIACFEIGLVTIGVGSICLHRIFDSGKDRLLERSSVPRVN